MAKRFLSNIRINDAYTFPASDGLNNQVIKTDGSGNLTFAQLAADSASVIYKDTFTGNGSTTVFNMANALNDEVQSNIYIDGVYQSKSTYSVVNKAITFSTAPLSGHEIEVISTTGINSGPTAIYTDTFTANGSTTAFTLGQTVHSENQTLVFLNGVYQFKGTYTLSGTTLTLDTAPSNGVAVEVTSIGSAYSGGDILYDHDFTSAGIMKTDGSGTYSILTDSSANWNTAYGWGDHGLSAQDKTDIGNLSGTNTGDQDLSSYATQTYVGTQITNLVDSSPATLNTLNELAAALGDDPNFATTTATSIGLKAPLASPSFTGIITANSSSSGDYVRLYGSSGTGKWDIYGNGANLRISDNESAGILAVDRGATFGGDVNVTGVGANSQRISTFETNLMLQLDGGANLKIQDTGSSDNYNGARLNLTANNFDGVVLMSTGAGVPVKIRVGGSANSGVIFTATGSEFKGNVGIGLIANASYSKLQVKTPASSYGFDLIGRDAGSNGESQITFWNSNQTTQLAAIFNTTDNLGFVTGTTEAMRINSSGNIGIGTTSPSSKLHLRDPGTNSDVGIKIGNDSRDWNLKVMGSVSDSLQFFTHDNSNVMTILPSGNVGIGTVSPGTKLDVNGAGSTGTISWANDGGRKRGYLYSDSAGVAIYSTALNKAGIYMADDVQIDFRVNGSTRMIINSSGNVGIGTTSPSQKLHVVGNIKTFGHIFLQSNANGFRTVALDTTDGADNQELYLCGGGTASSTRGGQVGVYGNEVSGAGGSVVIVAGNVSTGDIDFLTANTQRMIINNAGNVGIGTTSPSQKLDIAGDVRIKDGRSLFLKRHGDDYAWRMRNESAADSSTYGFDGSNDLVFEVVSNSGADNLPAVASHSVYPSSVNTLVLRETGRVGMGTATPGGRLHVQHDIGGEEGVNFMNNHTGAGAAMRLEINVGAPAGNDPMLSFNVGNGGFDWTMGVDNSDSDKFKISGGTDSHNPNLGTNDRLTINNAGNVGIGEPNPNYKLNVASGTNTDGIYLSGLGNAMSTGEYRQLQFGYSDTDTSYGSTIRFVVPDASNHGGQIEFYTDAGPSGSASQGTLALGMLINNNQKVAIGTTTASAKLTIISSGADGIQLGSDTSSTGNSGRIFWSNTSGGWAMMALGEVLSIRSSAVPGSTSGNPRVQLTNYSSTAWTASSDESLKENINSIGNVLDKIDGYRCIEYNLIDDKTKDKKIGFIAQDWQKDFPQIVEQMEDEKIGMKYTETIPILLKAIQELKARIETLENK